MDFLFDLVSLLFAALCIWAAIILVVQSYKEVDPDNPPTRWEYLGPRFMGLAMIFIGLSVLRWGILV